MKRARIMFDDDSDFSDVDEPAVDPLADTNTLILGEKISETVNKRPVKRRAANSSKKLNINVDKQSLILNCSWKDCAFSIKGDMSKFVDHVSSHISQLEVYNEEDSEDPAVLSMTGYKCLWGTCGAILEATLGAQLHMYCHASYKLPIEYGAAVMAHEKFPGSLPCKRETTYKHCIPHDFDHSQKPKCLWKSCTQPEFFSPYRFYQHVKGHTLCLPNKGRSKCEWQYCTKEFSNRFDLLRHMSLHTKEKEIACPNCGLSYSCIGKLHEHCVRQSEEKPFVCEQCELKYSSERLLRRHLLTHVNKYKCPFCIFTAPFPSSIASHVSYKHLPDRNFKCQLCTFSAKTKLVLQNHMNIHFTDAVRKCSDSSCDFQCRTLRAMKKHEAVKHGIGEPRLFKCSMCESKLSRGIVLQKHYSKVHKIQLPERIKYFNKDGLTYLELPKDAIPPKPVENVAQSDESNHSDNSLFIAYDQVDEEGNVTSKVLVGAQPLSYMPQVLTLPNDTGEGTSQQDLSNLKAIPITNNYPPMFIFQSSLDSLRAANKDSTAFEIITQAPNNPQ